MNKLQNRLSLIYKLLKINILQKKKPVLRAVFTKSNFFERLAQKSFVKGAQMPIKAKEFARN